MGVTVVDVVNKGRRRAFIYESQSPYMRQQTHTREFWGRIMAEEFTENVMDPNFK